MMIALSVRNDYCCHGNTISFHTEENCPEGATGDQCYTCVDGYYGDPKNNKLCQKCNCSGNSDLTDGAGCNNVNGKCLKCLNNTTGQNCHICVSGYYGDAVNGVCKRK